MSDREQQLIAFVTGLARDGGYPCCVGSVREARIDGGEALQELKGIRHHAEYTQVCANKLLGRLGLPQPPDVVNPTYEPGKLEDEMDARNAAVVYE